MIQLSGKPLSSDHIQVNPCDKARMTNERMTGENLSFVVTYMEKRFIATRQRPSRKMNETNRQMTNMDDASFVPDWPFFL